MCKKTEILPIGLNRFGEIFQWGPNEELEAVMFLLGMKRGYIKDVFQQSELGMIDIAWGTEKGGLAHIIQKHFIERDDFKSINEIVESIKDTLRNGTKTAQGTNLSFDYNKWRVSIAQSPEGKWILTAFDRTRTKEEKARDQNASL